MIAYALDNSVDEYHASTAATCLALLGVLLPMLFGSALRMVRKIHRLNSIPKPPLAGWLTGHPRLLMHFHYHRQMLAWANELGPVY